MRKKTGYSLRQLFGLPCLLTGVLLSTSLAQSGNKATPELDAGPSPVAQPALSAHSSRVLPSRTQRLAEDLRAKLQQNLVPHSARSTSAAVPADSAPAPNFGGFAGNVPLFPAANYVADSASGTYGVVASVTGDFNGDGNPDVATVQYSGEVDVLLGDGKGGFSAPVVSPAFGQNTHTLVTNVVAVDLNGDGKQDLLAFSGGVIACLNNGDGTFRIAGTIASQYQAGATAFAVADVNGDGHPDLVMVSNVSGKLTGPDSIAVQTFFNAGDGVFPATPSQVTTYPMPAGYFGNVLTGTASIVNIDGKPTLAFAAQESQGNYYSSTPPYSQYVFLAASNGDGTFKFNTPVSVPSALGAGYDAAGNGYGRQLLLQDLNNDGASDILVALGDGYLYSALSIGSGSFAAAVQAVPANGVFMPSLWLQDLDGDGIPDLVAPNNNFTAVFRGNGDGTYALINAATSGTPVSIGPTPLTVFGDFNGDGKLDYVSVDDSYGVAEFHAGQGGFSFAGAPRLIDAGTVDHVPAVPTQLVAQAALDLNGDGKTDIAGFNTAGSALLVVTGINQGNGAFKWTSNPNALPPLLVGVNISDVVADFNHDGKQDLILYGPGYDQLTHVYVLLSNGDGTLQAPVEIQLPNQPIAVNSANQFAVGDVNGDGNLDLVMTYGNPNGGFINPSGNQPSGYYVALGDGKGNFPNVTFTIFGSNVDLALLADFNGDGAPDLVLSNIPDGTDPSLSVLLNDGKGNFAARSPKVISYTEIPVTLRAGDVNQDGKMDLLMSTEGVYTGPQSVDYSQAGLVIYPGKGDGTVGDPTLMDAGEIPVITLADFNGDGLPDILSALLLGDLGGTPHSIADPFYGASLLLNTGSGIFASPINTFVPYGAQLLATGNFYGDGVTDLLVADGSGATLLYNQGGSTLTLSASGTSVTQDDTVIVTGKLVANLPSRPTPSGSITFYDGATILGTATLDGTGTATYATSSLSVGSHAITASYAGDANFNSTMQTAPIFIAVAALPPAFDLVSSNSSVTIAKSSSSTSSLTLTLTPNATFSGAVTLTATGVPAGVTLQFSKAAIQLAGGLPVQVPVTISTGKTTASMTEKNSMPWRNAGVGVSIAGLVLIGFPRRRRKWSVVLILLAVPCLAALASMTGCGGSSSLPRTGSAQIAITATPSGSATGAQSTTVTLIIQ